MGEARRRKEQGLSFKTTKKSDRRLLAQNFFSKYPRLPYILVVLGIIYLIFDLVQFYG